MAGVFYHVSNRKISQEWVSKGQQIVAEMAAKYDTGMKQLRGGVTMASEPQRRRTSLQPETFRDESSTQ